MVNDVTATPDASPSTVSLPLPETIEASGSPAPTTNPDAAPEIGGTPTPPSASVIAPPAATSAAAAIAPMRWEPKRRSGLAGVIDEFRDAIAGHPTQIYTDANGNRYVGEARQTSGQKWARIAAMAATGAAAGYGAGQGPGGQGRAGLAGIGVGLQQGAQRQQQTKEQQAEVRQDTLDKFNSRMTELKLAESTFRLKRLGIEADQNDYKFSQEQIQHEREMKSTDLGIYPDHYDVANVLKRDPNFWKDVHDGRIVQVAENSADGKRLGVHLFLRDAGMADTVAPAGSTVFRYEPSSTPGEPGKLIAEKSTQSMSEQKRMDSNNAAKSQYDAAVSAINKTKMDATELDYRKQATKREAAQTAEAYSAAAKNNAEARKLKIETEQLGGIDDNTSAQTLGQMLVWGTAAPSLIKNRKNYQQALAWAEKQSMEQTGQHFDATMSETLYKSYQKGVERYLSGDKADTIASFDKFLGHALEASQTINNSRNTNTRLINTPYNELRRQLNVSSSPQLHAMMSAIEVARTEWQTFLKNNHALTDDDRKYGDVLMSPNSKPADMQQSLKEWARTATTRLRSDDFEFLRLTRGKSHVPNLVSDQGMEALRHFGIDPRSIYASMPTAEQMPGMGAPGAPAATATPRPAGVPANYIHFQSSDKHDHWVDPNKLDDAKRIDPNLQVIP